MRVTVVGCSGSLPGPTAAASCYLVSAQDAAGRTWRVLLDLGSGAIGPLQDHVDPTALDAVLLSHLHPDHCLDVAPLYVLLRYGQRPPRDAPLPVWGPRGVAERLARAYDAAERLARAYDAAERLARAYDAAERLARAYDATVPSGVPPTPGSGSGTGEDSLDDRMAFRELHPGHAVVVGPLSVTPVRVHHPVEAYGFRVEADGVVLAYSGDSDAGPGVDAVAAGADLFLCEAGSAVDEEDVAGLHMSGRQAGEAAARAGAGLLVLTHVPPWHDPNAAAVAARAQFAGPVDVAVPGRSWRVGATRAVTGLVDRLDPEHRAEVEAAHPIDIVDLEAVRGARTAATLMAARPPRPGVERIEQVVQTGDGVAVRVRLHRPSGLDQGVPALLWLHGGGYVMGDAAEDDARCEAAALAAGCLVAAVDYRLAPEHPYPAALRDAAAVLAWLAREGARDLGVDATRLAVGGYSAGGGLAAALAVLARDEDGPRLVLQLLLAPMLDDRDRRRSAPADRRVWHRGVNALAWQAYLGGVGVRAGTEVPASAAAARGVDLDGLAPAYLAVGDLDLFLDEDVDYARRLGHAGVPVELRTYPGAFHGSFLRVPGAELSRRFVADADDALRRAFARGSA